MRLQTALFFIFYLIQKTCISTENYGPFHMLITKFDICTGPRNKNCTVFNATLLGGGKLNVDLKVTQNSIPSKAKILAISNGRELVRFQMNKPCGHLFLRPLFESLFTVTKNCVILKGNYNCKLDIEQMCTNYFGGKFFYGNMTFKAVVYGNDCNFSCTLIHVTLSPK